MTSESKINWKWPSPDGEDVVVRILPHQRDLMPLYYYSKVDTETAPQKAHRQLPTIAAKLRAMGLDAEAEYIASVFDELIEHYQVQQKMEALVLPQQSGDPQ